MSTGQLIAIIVVCVLYGLVALDIIIGHISLRRLRKKTYGGKKHHEN